MHGKNIIRALLCIGLGLCVAYCGAQDRFRVQDTVEVRLKRVNGKGGYLFEYLPPKRLVIKVIEGSSSATELDLELYKGSDRLTPSKLKWRIQDTRHGVDTFSDPRTPAPTMVKATGRRICFSLRYPIRGIQSKGVKGYDLSPGLYSLVIRDRSFKTQVAGGVIVVVKAYVD